MDGLLQQLINAVSLAAIYALIAVGISLFFGVIGVVNLAHGDIATVGIFATLSVVAMAGAPGVTPVELAALAAGIAAAAAAGCMFYWIALKPLSAAPPIMGLLSSVGAGFVVREALLNFYPNGRNPQQFPAVLPERLYEFGGVLIQAKHIAVLTTAIVVSVALSWCIQRTRFGRSVRSLINNREVATAFGVPAVKTTVLVFALGSALAGLAGVMNGMYYNMVQSDMGVMLTLKGFTAAVVGGLGNMYGALVGALLIGIVEAFTAGFIPDGGAYKDVAVFGILIVALVLRPNGLLIRRVQEKV
jgi:branched-chain amino acid transport system permease protein